jgi:hypothetical protein
MKPAARKMTVAMMGISASSAQRSPRYGTRNGTRKTPSTMPVPSTMAKYVSPARTVLLKGWCAKRMSRETSRPRSAGAVGNRMKERDQRLYSLPIVSDLRCSSEQLFTLLLRLADSEQRQKSHLVASFLYRTMAKSDEFMEIASKAGQ